MIFKDRENTKLSDFEQAKFHEMMYILLYGKEPKPGSKSTLPSLDRKNIIIIGNIILQNYLTFLFNYENLMLEKYARSDLSLEKRTELMCKISERQANITELIYGKEERNLDFLTVLFEKIQDLIGSFTDTYKESAFSPGISEKLMGFNCFGFTQVIGAILIRAGFEIKLAIGVNHSFCLLELEGKTVFVSNYGINEMELGELGLLSKKKPYFIDLNIYKTEYDNENMKESIMVVTEFNEGVVYEYLENLAALRNFELFRSTKHLLSNVVNHREIVAMMHRQLVGVNWQGIQVKIFPEIRRVFSEKRREFDLEYKKMEPRYIDIFLGNVINDLFEYYYSPIYMRETRINSDYHWKLYLGDRKIEIKEALLYYSEDVLKYVEKGEVFGPNVPVFFTSFIYFIVEFIKELKDEELSKGLMEKFLKPIYRQKGIEKEKNEIISSIKIPNIDE